MRLELLDYELPEAAIAEHPPSRRDGGKLLVLPPDAGPARHALVTDLAQLLPAGALLVVNDTRVIPARLFGHKPTGGRVEVMLVERVSARSPSNEVWLALVRASKSLKPGVPIAIERGEGLRATLLAPSGSEEPGAVHVELSAAPGSSVMADVERAGHVPLPPYLRRADEPADRERYQSIFARAPGAVAAPTASLHLSQELMAAIEQRGVRVARITLHVSLGTFQPVKVDDLDQHVMHAESYELSAETAQAVADARARSAPVVAVGTTSVRALESAADPARPGQVLAGGGRTRLLIQPGYAFRVVDSMLTNFHLPRSTLLALVCAFAGRERVLAAYAEALQSGYRFFSYGDAMLLSRSAA